MKLPLSLLVSCIILSLFYISCGDEPSSIGVNLLQGDFVIVSTFDTKDDSISQSSSDFKKVVSLGLASKILIGKREDVEASTLMKFVFAINDSLRQDFLDGNIRINEAMIELSPNYIYTDSSAAFDFTVHNVTSTWTSTGFTSDSLSNLIYDPLDVSSDKNFTDSLYSFVIDSSTVLPWIKNSIDSDIGSNNGIYYKPSAITEKVVGFQALTLTSTTAAKIIVVIEKPGTFIDTINGFIYEDVSAIERGSLLLPEGEIAVQSSVTFQSKLFFDVSAVDSAVIVNNAELILVVDSINTITGSSFNSNLSVYRITDSSNVKIDETFSVTLRREGNIYTGDITAFVTRWLSSIRDNQGLVIRSQSYTEGLELFAIKGSSSTLQSDRPRLKVVYTRLEE